MKDVISKEQFYPQPINDVWAAISEQEKISQWFIKCKFKAEPGFKYSLLGEEDNDVKVSGEVLKANPVSELVYSWVVAGTETVTTVSWKLEEKDGGTLLTLEHSGISNYPDEQTAVTMMQHFDAGWDKCYEHLGKFLEGETIEAAHGR